MNFHHVTDGDERECGPPGLASRGIGRAGACCSLTTTQNIRADDKESVGIEGLARANHPIPPAGLFTLRAVLTGHICVTSECMADVNGVGGIHIELPVGLVSHANGPKFHTAFKFQRRLRRE